MKHGPLSRRGFLAAMGGAAAASFLRGANASAGEIAGARKPNIIHIISDDHGYADVGVHGCKDVPTPNMDSLARDGVRCTNGYVSCPVCSPTRAGVITGRYQQRFGHETNAQAPEGGLPLREITLPQMLRQAGYATGMVGKWHLGAGADYHPLRRGFEEFFGFLGGAHPYLGGGRPGSILRGTESIDEKEYLTDALGREAVAFIERNRGRPFFLYLTFNAVHAPLQATEKYLARFPQITAHPRKTYAAMLSALDENIGRVLAKVRDLGLDEQTLIFFHSDNGGPPGNGSSNAPLTGHKGSVWEGGIRVPYLVRWKGTLPAGKVYEKPVITLDILSTAAAAAGASLPTDRPYDGVNLLPHLKGEKGESPHQALFWRFGQGMEAVRAGAWKLMTIGKETSLFNLESDIAEKNDLAAREPEKLKELGALLAAWQKDFPPPPARPPRAAKKKVATDKAAADKAAARKAARKAAKKEAAGKE